jgi:phage host-nuclease inhibitor protein Gam
MIREIGDLQRDFVRIQADMNDAIAAATDHAQPMLSGLTARIEALQAGVQTWCEAHRAELTRDGRVKSANLVTGEVQWRQRPPSVRVRALDAVLAEIRARGLADAYIRTTEALDKAAVLASPDEVAGIPGLAVVTGVEDFVITPFEFEQTAA